MSKPDIRATALESSQAATGSDNAIERLPALESSALRPTLELDDGCSRRAYEQIPRRPSLLGKAGGQLAPSNPAGQSNPAESGSPRFTTWALQSIVFGIPREPDPSSPLGPHPVGFRQRTASGSWFSSHELPRFDRRRARPSRKDAAWARRLDCTMARLTTVAPRNIEDSTSQRLVRLGPWPRRFQTRSSEPVPASSLGLPHPTLPLHTHPRYWVGYSQASSLHTALAIAPCFSTSCTNTRHVFFCRELALFPGARRSAKPRRAHGHGPQIRESYQSLVGAVSPLVGFLRLSFPSMIPTRRPTPWEGIVLLASVAVLLPLRA